MSFTSSTRKGIILAGGSGTPLPGHTGNLQTIAAGPQPTDLLPADIADAGGYPTF
jgi:hypothetical protein